jgi:hypothetical protein
MAGRYPSKGEWKRFFKPLPLWVVLLIVALLYGRLLVLAFWHWVVG